MPKVIEQIFRLTVDGEETKAELKQCEYWDSESKFCALCRPSAQPDYDLSGYSDRLWQAAYERGKAEAEVKHGEWIIDENDPERDTQCSICGFVLDDWIQGELYSFCPNCGADMRKETGDGVH